MNILAIFSKDNRFYIMGIAIIWIVVFHVYYWYVVYDLGPYPIFLSVFHTGWVGVDIFFFLSAYGLQASIENNSLRTFYLNRVKRLFPVYFFFLLVLFLCFDQSCSFSKVLEQCLFQITGVSLFKYNDYFSTGFCFDWFTPAIIVVYIVFPMMSKLIKLVMGKGVIGEILLLASLVLASQWLFVNRHFHFTFLAIRFPIIILGVLTYLHGKENEYKKIFVLYLVSACMGLAVHSQQLAISLLMPSVITVLSMAEITQPMKRFVELLGRHTFEIYLAHIFPVAFFFSYKWFTNISILFVITVVSTAVLAAIFSYGQNLFQKIM